MDETNEIKDAEIVSETASATLEERRREIMEQISRVMEIRRRNHNRYNAHKMFGESRVCINMQRKNKMKGLTNRHVKKF